MIYYTCEKIFYIHYHNFHKKVVQSMEIKVDKIRPILSRTNLKGDIRSCNSYFCEVSGYTKEQLIGSRHNIVRHPDMPKVIFKMMWERIQKNKNMIALIKNKTASGDYYWVTTLFETSYHPITNEEDGYMAIRRAAPKQAIKKIIPLYKKLLEIEHNFGVGASEAYLLDFLRYQNADYDSYINKLLDHKSFIGNIFHKIVKSA